MIDSVFDAYARGLDAVLRHRILTVTLGFGLLAVTLAVLWPIMRKEFFPEVDGGAFEMLARAPRQVPRIEVTEQKIARRSSESIREERSTRKTCNSSSPSWASTPTGRPPTRRTPARWTPSSRSSSRPEREKSVSAHVHLIPA